MVRLVARKRYETRSALSRRAPAAILSAVSFRSIEKCVAVVLCVTVLFMGLPRPVSAGDERPAVEESSAPATRGADVAVASYRLRDAIPVAGFVAAPPDTTDEDDFFLPEETDRRKLMRDITVFLIASAFVAVFIIKVFIEKDEEPEPVRPPGKSVPPPE